ncbi:MAG: cytochrome c peroxidase [Bacteroidota bacterium]
MNRFWTFIFLYIALLGAGCIGDDMVDDQLMEMELEVPDHFPLPEIPANNPLTPAKADLGKRLFFDPILSRDRNLSCGSCHFQEHAFADPRRLSLGTDSLPGSRNAPPLFNLVYHKSFFWDGANPSLEQQALFPIESHFELATPLPEVLRRLKADSDYPVLFHYTFGDTITAKYLVQALASFERTLISAGSKYDQFLATGLDSAIFSAQEWRGYKLFFSETDQDRHAECFHCHGGFNLDDPEGRFRNNGLYLAYEDDGRYLVTGDEFDRGKFKVPSLRNIEHTAPYMHDGSLATLEEVLDHYASGGHLHQNRDILMGMISIDSTQKQDILAFLKTLSDPGFLSNPAFRPD